MKVIFVDAENIGLKALAGLNADFHDKVLVFSNVDSVKKLCAKSLFYYLSDYPVASNQADFYIVAYLARIVATLDKTALSHITFNLYTNDEALITAFTFQCQQMEVQPLISRTKPTVALKTTSSSPSSKPTKATKLPQKTAKEKLLAALNTPRKLAPTLQKELGLSKPEFTRAIQELIALKCIKRCPKSKKMWVKSKTKS